MKDHLRERETKREFRRGSFHGNGRGNRRGFHSQASSERDQRDRQEEEWLIPVSTGRRGRDIPVWYHVEQELPHTTRPAPAPSKDRFFTDWSSIRMGSPLVRTPPQSVPVRERRQDINQPPDGNGGPQMVVDPWR